MRLFLQIAFLLIVILLSAKLGGYISIQLGQPAVLGDLIAGVLLGPTVLNLFQLPFEKGAAETIANFGELGVLLLMFLAGLEVHFHELKKNMSVAGLAGLLGVLFPVLFGYVAGSLFGFAPSASLFLGLTLGATSVSISAQTLIELKSLRSRVGISLLGAAVFDDILVILFLSVFLGLHGGGGSSGEIFLVIAKMALFLILSTAFGLWALPWVMRRASGLPVSQGALTVSLAILLAYGLAAEVLGGMAAITGAFLAGLMLARAPEKERIEAGVNALAYGMFVPIFFVNIGLFTDLRNFQMDSLLLTAAITAAAVAGKWLGSGWGARLGGLSWREAVQLGAGMISRGEVGLIVASLGLADGLITTEGFSAVIVMILVTTLITPPILRALFARGNSPSNAPHQQKRPIYNDLEDSQ